MRVVMIEDNPEIVEAVALAFQIRWPESTFVATHLGRKGVDLVDSESPDIVILDLGLPDTSGFEVLAQIRHFSNVPVLVLTVRSEEREVVKALDSGADDYMVKPFRQLELLARVKALTRRQHLPEQQTEVACGPLRLDLSTRQLTCGRQEVKLTSTEGRILTHLMRNAGRVVTHSSLVESVWGEDYEGAAESLKVHIRRLREKLEPDPSHPQFLRAKTGVGYWLAKPSEPA
ncbi:MAG: DNA-binding response regulator [Chloroflexi bacterium]|nr:MAG: DNA-binding response regulator [Chloroflexota bacterium]